MENIYQNPVVFKIHNGTARSTINLCGNCRMAHRTIGSQTGTERVRCMAVYNQPIDLHEPVAQCSAYQDRNLPTLSDMQEIAWTLMTDKGGRKIGFHSPEQRRDNNTPSTPIGF